MDAAYAAVLTALRKLPRTVSLERFQEFTTEPVVIEIGDDYRRLGTAMTRLAGSTCSIGLPSSE